VAIIAIALLIGLMTVDSSAACYNYQPKPIDFEVSVLGQKMSQSTEENPITISLDQLDEISAHVHLKNPHNYKVRLSRVYAKGIQLYSITDSVCVKADKKVVNERWYICVCLKPQKTIDLKWNFSYFDYVDEAPDTGLYKLQLSLKHTRGYTKLTGFFLILAEGIPEQPNNNHNGNHNGNNTNGDPQPPPMNNDTDGEFPPPHNGSPFNNTEPDNDSGGDDDGTKVTHPDDPPKKKQNMYLEIRYNNISVDQEFTVTVHVLTKDREVIEDATVWMLINGSVYELEKQHHTYTLTLSENFFEVGNHSVTVKASSKKFKPASEVIAVEVFPLPEPIPFIIFFAVGMMSFVGTVSIWQNLNQHLRRKEMKRRDVRV
jgi:hypothetical protein